VETLKVNIRIACDKPDTTNEYIDEKPFIRDLLFGHDSLFAFLLVAYVRDLALLQYFYEKLPEHFQLCEHEILALFKLVVSLGWKDGLLFLMNSDHTSFIFNLSSKDFKLDFVHFMLSSTVLESDQINPNKAEDDVKEIKHKMASFPYCCVSWLFIEPDGKNNFLVK